MTTYSASSPVLFIIYNRPETTRQTFEAIKNVQPQRLYIAADGPKTNKDIPLCTETKEILKSINWPCDIKTLFRENNLGCKKAVSSAISWFFDQEEMGIILEDDCLPAVDFFIFCDEMLQKYKDKDEISIISGCNFQHGKKRGDFSYYFSHLTHIWGWASWRRVWNDYSLNMDGYEEPDAKRLLMRVFKNKNLVGHWMHIFLEVKNGKIDTWDYQFAFMNFFKNRLSVIPNTNLISNIGFGVSATHTHLLDRNANIPFQSLKSIEHPTLIKPNKWADFDTLSYDFGLKKKRIKWYLMKLRLLFNY